MHTIQGQIGAVLYLSIPAFAAWKGGPAERWTALVVFLDSIIYLLGFDHIRPWDPQFRLVAIEGAELVGLLVVASRYPKRWLLAAAGSQLLCVVLRVIPLLDDRIHVRAWLTLEIILGYIVLLCLLVGTVQVMRARTDATSAPDQP